MNPYASYQRNQVLEAAPEDILLQLVQGAVIRSKQARELWEQGEKIRAREKRLVVYDIVAYLDGTLDRENGAQIAADLEALYAYVLREITESTRSDDFQRLEVVEDVLSTLYEGWKDAVVEYKKTQTQQPQPAGAGYGQAVHYESAYSSAG